MFGFRNNEKELMAEIAYAYQQPRVIPIIKKTVHIKYNNYMSPVPLANDFEIYQYEIQGQFVVFYLDEYHTKYVSISSIESFDIITEIVKEETNVKS